LIALQQYRWNIPNTLITYWSADFKVASSFACAQWPHRERSVGPFAVRFRGQVSGKRGGSVPLGASRF
jgi:hypothetical protein